MRYSVSDRRQTAMIALFLVLSVGLCVFAATLGGVLPRAVAADAKQAAAAPANAPQPKQPEKAAAEKPDAAKAPAEAKADVKAGEVKGGEIKGAAKTGEATDSFLAWLYKSMGLRYVLIFLAVTFNEVALLVMIVFGLRRKAVCPPELVEEFDARLKKKQYQEAYDLARESNSFLGKVLSAGMANISEGYDEAVAAMQEVGEEQALRLEQRNGNIALIAQLGPMLGLLATVDGIVRAFAVISKSEVTPKPSELAQGIGIALVNTIVGLTIAIISIVIYHYIRNRLTRLILETGIVSGRLMKRFSGKKANRAEEVH